jgi:hypothetical protein
MILLKMPGKASLSENTFFSLQFTLNLLMAQHAAWYRGNKAKTSLQEARFKDDSALERTRTSTPEGTGPQPAAYTSSATRAFTPHIIHTRSEMSMVGRQERAAYNRALVETVFELWSKTYR